MTQRTVIVSGCGNIGSRLLQSLARVAGPALNIYGVEPFEAARETSQERFEQARDAVGHDAHSLQWVGHEDAAQEPGLPETVDLAVVSCDAANRLDALRGVLGLSRPRNIVLEKILFTRPADFEAAREAIDAVGARCWVNTSRNLWPGYQALKARLSGRGPIDYRAEGLDWNLGSNAIHFLSVVEYLTDSEFVELSFETLGAGQRDAKRAGYREVIGTLAGRTRRGDTVTLVSDPDAEAGLRVRVSAGEDTFSIAEGPQTLDGPDGREVFGMLHASQLEDAFAEILNAGRCDLPTLSESTRLHMLFFDAIAPALGLKPGDEIPVT